MTRVTRVRAVGHLVGLALTLAVALLLAVRAAEPAGSAEFYEPFAAEAGTLARFGSADRWLVTTANTWNYPLRDFECDHGWDGAPPPATHWVSDLADTLYVARPATAPEAAAHLMICSGSGQHSTATVMPAITVSGDFTVTLDISSGHSGGLNAGYSWLELCAQPYATTTTAPSAHWNGTQLPPGAWCVVGRPADGGFTLYQAVGTELVETPGKPDKLADLVPLSAMRRDPYVLKVEDGLVTVGIQKPDGEWFYWLEDAAPFEALPAARAYTLAITGHSGGPPEGQCGGDGTCARSFTWHIDNVRVAPVTEVDLAALELVPYRRWVAYEGLDSAEALIALCQCDTLDLNSGSGWVAMTAQPLLDGDAGHWRTFVIRQPPDAAVLRARAAGYAPVLEQVWVANGH